MPLQITDANIENFAVIYLPWVKECMEVGHVVRLQSILRQHLGFVEQSGREDFIEAFAEARIWLLEAERFEQVHGQGSCFNPEHPIIVAIDAKNADIQRRKADALRSMIASYTGVHLREIKAA